MGKKKYLLVSTLILSTLGATALSSCGTNNPPAVNNQKEFQVKLQYNGNEGAVYADYTSGTLVDSTKVKISIYPNDGYEISSIKVNNEDKAIEKSFYFTPIEGENIVAVTFTKTSIMPVEDTYTIKTLVNKGGIITPSKTSGTVGEKVAFEVTPDQGYELTLLKINDAEVSLATREFAPIKGENTISAEFSKLLLPPSEETFTIKTIIGEGGNVTTNKVNGNVGETVTFTITTEDGYEIESIKINGAEVSLTTREFTPIKGENTLEVTFKEIVIVPTQDTYTIKTLVNEGGAITPNKTAGNVGEIVSFGVTIDEGFELVSLKINNAEVSLTTREFSPIKGENVIEATFSKTIIPTIDTYSILITSDSNGVVTVDKSTGNVGDLVKITIVANEGFELATLKINGIDVSLETREFAPIKGMNTIDVTFKVTNLINRGFEYTGLDYTRKTDFKDLNDFGNSIVDNLEKLNVAEFKQPTYRETFLKFLSSIDGYNLLAVRYGIQKNTLNAVLSSTEFMNALQSVKDGFGFNSETINGLIKFVSYFVNNYSLEDCAAILGFLAIYGGGTAFNVYITGYGDIDYISSLDEGIAAFKDENDVVNYALDLKNNSRMDIITPLAKFLDTTDILTEFIFRIVKDLLAEDYTVDSLSKVISNFITLIDGVFGNHNINLTDEDYTELFKFIYKLFDRHFFSKNSFKLMLSKLAANGDPVDLLYSTFTKDYTSVKGITLIFSNIIKILNENSDLTYYLFKLIGKAASKVDTNFISDLVTIVGNPSSSAEIITSQIIVKISKLINSSINMLYPFNNEFVELLKGSTNAISSLIDIAKTGVINDLNIVKIIDMNTLVTNLVEYSKYDEDNLTSEQVSSIYEYYTSTLQLITTPTKVLANYQFVVDDVYKIGDEINAKVFIESEEVTGSFKISGFDSSYAHKGKIRLESTDGFVAYFNYEVNNSGDKMSIYPYISCDLNATTLDGNYFVIVSPDGTKSYEKLDSFTHSPLDTSTAGEKIGYIKYKNDFYFFKYTVR